VPFVVWLAAVSDQKHRGVCDLTVNAIRQERLVLQGLNATGIRLTVDKDTESRFSQNLEGGKKTGEAGCQIAFGNQTVFLCQGQLKLGGKTLGFASLPRGRFAFIGAIVSGKN
jgi:hypothetical protein